MVERKTAMRRAPERPDLQRQLEAARTVTLTEEQLQEQRASFTYGNAPTASRITKVSATTATKSIRLQNT